MAFDNKALTPLSVGSPGAGPRIWGYVSSTDNKATVGVADYFRTQTAGGLKAGDMVIANCSNGPIIVCITAITSSTSTIVLTTPAAPA